MSTTYTVACILLGILSVGLLVYMLQSDRGPEPYIIVDDTVPLPTAVLQNPTDDTPLQTTPIATTMNTQHTFVIIPPEATLTDVQVSELFELLEQAREEHIASGMDAHRRPLSLDQYVYQLVVGENADKELLVGVRALPPSAVNDPQWQQSALVVHDGGNAYLDALVNLSTKTVSNFYVHGEG